MVDNDTLIASRTALHAVAEFLIAGPQYLDHGTIKMTVSPRGFSGTASDLRVDGTDLVRGDDRTPITGSIRELAAAIGVEPSLPDVYSDHVNVSLDDSLEVDPAAAELIASWFDSGDKALRGLESDADPVLWPEHFDIAVSAGDITFGVSAGDSSSARPYAYVSPWSPRRGSFWTASFGAVRSIDEVGDTDALADFFVRGRSNAASDPAADS